MNIKPLNGRVLIEMIPDTRNLASGLYIAEKIKEKPHRCLVLACGGAYTDRSSVEWHPPCQAGEIVHIKRNSTLLKTFNIDGREVSLIWFDDVVAVE